METVKNMLARRVVREWEKALKHMSKEELYQRLEDMIEYKDSDEFDVFSGGYSKNNYQEYFYEEDIDIGCELAILDRKQLLDSLKIIDGYIHIKCNDGYRKIELHKNKNNTYELLLFPDIITGELKVDILRYWFNNVAEYKVINESEKWTSYKIRLNDKLLVWSVHDNNKYCRLEDYNNWKHYYSKLLKGDGSRNKKHRYSSCNIIKPIKVHEMYGDLGAMFGSSFDDQIEENIEKAIDLLEEYGYKCNKVD